MTQLPAITTAPEPEPADGVFPALLEGLREFRARVEGTDASGGAILDKVLELEDIPANPADDAPIGKKVAMAVLRGLRDILAALHEAIDGIDRFLGPADAVVALIEVFGRALSALGDTLDQPWPPPMAFANEAGRALGEVGDALAGVGDIELPSIIPSPSTLTAILAETRALLGELVDPEADPPTGSLVALITRLEPA